ncbi:2-C-methyl-D-erythritol 4-phosphate cytidylyltransferase [Protaetiibacter intestinalis]|uniref:Bifunctional enzyme IspD/IspF n=1 Tax=Protaetiibacter intestinalis TaxID=2419774 RepID=A0A387B8Y0_9MICO|nr:2-C-methyl-D-erythritol 4-phosphate cytidylyltransferase [Protaetiibacter intestinalis]AYF97419.1 2-C-methyl-D-erythritol 2,4-cyclodiphosphate synthase [Protaetiibacter intestinalis]
MTPTPDAVRLAVVVVAAGGGTRLGREEPKAFVQLHGATILEHALRGVFASVEPAQVIVVAPAALLARARAIGEHVAGAASEHLTVVAGGETRQQSVVAGLAALAEGVQAVLVHDAARALAPSALIDRVAHAVLQGGEAGVIPALPVIDTVKRVEGERVVGAVDRSDLVHVQTPQGFPRAALEAAYAAATEDFTDDAALFAAAGGAVVTVPGEPRAFKITTPWDLNRAEQLLDGGSRIRTGVGVDVHRYDEAVPLWLGGVYFPDEPGLDGHSDGDAVIHAICDALLSAAGLGDLGSRFGSADPRFADAASGIFLRETLALVAGAGFTVGNVAVQVVANRPRLAARRMELEAHLGELVGAPVSVAATTSDGLGFTGRGEGLLAVATALLTR